MILTHNLLELDRVDLRRGPLMHRKATLASLCKLGLEGIVSKRRDRPYRHGRSREWLKIKNPASAAMTRVWEDRF